MSDIINAYSIKLINSFLLTLLFLGGYLLCKFFLTRRIKAKKLRSQYIIRWKYFFFIVFTISFIKIWGVEGLQGLFSFLGFLSAAFTLTQRENLMNLVGWLIINWRGLFSEGDYIRISNFTGRVKSIGVLYFTLIESSLDFPDNPSGRIIKIPNGMVSRNPIVNFSQEKFVECTMNFVFKPKGNLNSVEVLYLVLKQEMLRYLQLQSNVGDKYALEAYEPIYSVRIRREKPAGYEMVFLFYCKFVDTSQIQYKLNKLVMEYSAENPDLTLAFD